MTARRAAVVAVVLLAGLALAGVGAAQSPAEEPDPADEIYVDEQGDAVLVYAADDPEDNTTAQFGAHVADGLAYALLERPVAGTPEIRGNLTAQAAADRIESSGSLSLPQPPAVRELSVAVSSLATASTSRSDLSVDATVLDETGVSQFVRSAATSGELRMTASSIEFHGEFGANSVVPAGRDMHLAAMLRETGGGYELTVDQNQTIAAATAAAWHNRSRARATLERQYVQPAAALGGRASLSIESLALGPASGDRRRLDVSYTVTYRDIDAALGRMVRAALAEDPSISSDQAEQIARDVQAAAIEEASIRYDVTNGDPSGALTLDISAYRGLLVSYLEIAETMEGTTGQPGTRDPAQLREQFEAQAAAGLVQQTAWSGNLSHPDGDSVRVRFGMHTRTQNWQAYMDELATRDLPRVDSEFDLTARSTGERIAVDGSLALSGDALFEQLFGQFNATATDDPEAAAFLDAVADAEPRTARLATRYDADGFRLEAGAAFRTLEPIREALAAESALPPVTEVVGRIDADGGSTYVQVADAVDAGASRDTVRALPYVDDDTQVYMPGEGDPDVPAMDTERARAFLDIQSAGGSGPGVGPAVAALAVVAAALLARRWR